MKMNRRRFSIESLEKRIVLDAMGPVAPAAPPAWESVIVQLNDNVAKPNAVTQGFMSAYGGQLGHVYEYAVKGFSAQLPAAGVAAIGSSPWVKIVEPDLEMHAFAHEPPTGVRRIGTLGNLIANINDQDDHRVDVGIAIIDTGIDGTHPDLNVVGGYNATGGSTANWSDGNGHGTHVAGIAAALDNDFGVVGVAPGARLHAVKVLGNNGSGSLSNIIKGIDWVTANAATIEVANMSLGGLGVSSIYHTAIKNSVAKGVVYVVAAGNSYRDILGSDLQFGTSDDTVPAAYPEVATISAFADSNGEAGGQGSPVGGYADDTFADFSNFSNEDANHISWYDNNNKVNNPLGAGIDLVMPGVDILSTYRGGGYATMSGTSMASPHAAGLAALYIAQNGRASDATGVYAIRQALIDNGKAWRNNIFGLQYNVQAGTSDSPDNREENLGWAGVIDHPPTVVSLSTSPTDLASWSSGGVVTLNAAASDDMGVNSVEFFVINGSLIAVDSDGSDGWSVQWTPASVGVYSLKATATDTIGQTGSLTISVTVGPVVVPTSMHIGDLDGTSTKQGRRNWTWTATVEILVQDNLGNAVPSATVTGHWNDGSPGSGITGNDGKVATISKSSISSSVDSVAFTVDSVSAIGLSYDATKNQDPDDGSNGTFITVNRP